MIMAKPQFQQIDVKCWRHTGKLGTAAPAVCVFRREADLGPAILEALDELRGEIPPSQRLLTFRPSGRKRCLSTLRLRLVPAREELRVMNIACDPATVTIEMTELGLQLVRDAVNSWCNGGEDFCVSPESANLKRREFGSLDKASGTLWFWGPTMEP